VSHKRNIKLLLAFDGTRYAGWQKQKLMQTIQGLIEEKLRIMTGEELCLHGAGRTDAGVHALGMVANYHTAANIPCQGFLKGLNSMLPPDIRVLEASGVEAAFHARIDAKAKTYWYNFNNSAIQLPTERLYAAHFFADLDFEAMRQGLEYLQGTHDFSSFEGAGSRDRESSKRGAVRTITEASLETLKTGKTGGDHRFIITGDGFLRHMVRNIVGTVLEVGKGKRKQKDIKGILAAKDRSAAGPTAPAAGLFLKEISYL
jgi:tRNA pseudouridine38-40 synthase